MSQHLRTRIKEQSEAQASAIMSAGGDRNDVLDLLQKQYAIFENRRDYAQWRMDLITEQIQEIHQKRTSK